MIDLGVDKIIDLRVEDGMITQGRRNDFSESRQDDWHQSRRND